MNFELLVCATIIVYIMLFVKLFITFTSGFDSGHAREIYMNKELFNPVNQNYKLIKNKIPWIDPVVYYDTIKLANRKELTIKNLTGSLI